MSKRLSEKRSNMRDRVKQRAKQREFRSGSYLKVPNSTNWFNPQDKTYLLNFIPFIIKDPNNKNGEVGEDWYERTYFTHTQVGAEEKTYVCPAKTIGKPCPLCESRAALIKESYDQNKDEIKDLRPSERQIFNVENADKEDGLKLMDISTFGFGESLDKELREGLDEYSGFAQLKDGYTLKVRFDKTSFDNFFKADRIDFIKREEYDESVLEDVVCLDEVLVILPYKELEKIFLELDENEEPDNSHSKEDENKTESKTEKKSYKKTNSGTQENETNTHQKKKKNIEKKETKKECPIKMKWGVDFDEYENCDTCEVKEDCQKDSPKKNTPSSDSSPTSTNECDQGGTWGKDCDQLEHCFECKNWEKCKDDQDKMKKG